jgi:hypothetical protein
MSKETYYQANQRLLREFDLLGWKVSDFSLKVPYTTSSSGIRFWFKPQTVYMSTGNKHELNDARSLWVDQRNMSAEQLIEIATRFHSVE